MRLSFDLIASAPQSINPAKDRMILLRGWKIPAIENLGATQDFFDCIDLSENDLIRLGNVPSLKRLRTLIVANNRIARISEDFAESAPNLESVILTSNKMQRLNDLEPLLKAKKLERLSLVDNPVTTQEYYRPFVVYHLQSLRFLDFKRIRDKEREEAKKLFGGEEGVALRKRIAPPRTAAQLADPQPTEPQPVTEPVAASPPTAATSGSITDIARIKEAIAKSNSIEEVARLEEALRTGIMPNELTGTEVPPPPPPPPQTDEDGDEDMSG